MTSPISGNSGSAGVFPNVSSLGGADKAKRADNPLQVAGQVNSLPSDQIGKNANVNNVCLGEREVARSGGLLRKFYETSFALKLASWGILSKRASLEIVLCHASMGNFKPKEFNELTGKFGFSDNEKRSIGFEILRAECYKFEPEISEENSENSEETSQLSVKNSENSKKTLEDYMTEFGLLDEDKKNLREIAEDHVPDQQYKIWAELVAPTELEEDNPFLRNNSSV